METIKNIFETGKNTNMDYLKSDTQKNIIIQKLKDKGLRITKQRLVLIDIILENKCSSCKEIFYKAVKTDNKIGVATVYRMINTLEEIGAIDRRNMYKLSYGNEYKNDGDIFVITLYDGTAKKFSFKEWANVISAGLDVCGYGDNKKVKSLEVRSAEESIGWKKLHIGNCVLKNWRGTVSIG